MAISVEAMNYLQELEKTPKWTEIPNDDERIVKLRLLFKVEQEEEKPKWIREMKVKEKSIRKRKPMYRVKAMKDDEEMIFDSVKDCAYQLNLGIRNLYEAINQGFKYKGMRFEKLPLLEEN